MPGTDAGSLRPKAARGVLVLILLNVLGTIFARAVQVLLPFYLLPSDFGIFALAAFFSGLLAMVADLGLSTALIQRKHGFEAAADAAFTLQFVVALGLVVSSVGVGILAADAYSEPRLALPVVILSLSLVCQAISMVPRVAATRALQFGRAAIPDNLGKSSGVLLTLALAMLGFAYWSPVYGTVLGAVTGSVLQLSLSRWRPRLKFDRKLAGELVGFGQFVLLAVFANYVAHSIDNVIVGYFLGLSALGYYAFAYSWGVYLTSSLSSVLSPVAYPVMANLAETPRRLKLAFTENLRYFGYVGSCFTFGVFTFAGPFVASFYGNLWSPAILPMRILAPIGLLMGYTGVCGDALYAIGKSRTVFIATWIEVAVLVVLLPPATALFGLAGTSTAALIAGIVVLVLVGFPASRAVGYTRSDWRLALRDTTVAGTSSTALSFVLSVMLPLSPLSLILQVAMFITFYAAGLQAITRGKFLSDLLQAFRLALSSRNPKRMQP